MKKKRIAATRVSVVCFFVAILLCCIMAATATALPDRVLSFSNFAPQLDTPEAIADYLWKNFVFEKDQRLYGKSDYWQSPEEFLKTRKGDCEDFAIFAQALLRRNGISSFLLSIYGRGYAHTVCVFLQNGVYHMMDGSQIVHTKTSNLKGLMTEIHPFWTHGAVVGFDKNRGKGRVLSSITR